MSSFISRVPVGTTWKRKQDRTFWTVRRVILTGSSAKKNLESQWSVVIKTQDGTRSVTIKFDLFLQQFERLP